MNTNPTTLFTSIVNAEVRDLMEERGFSQSSLSRVSGVSQSRISRIIFSEITPMPIDMLDDIAVALGTTASAILRRAEARYAAIQSGEQPITYTQMLFSVA